MAPLLLWGCAVVIVFGVSFKDLGNLQVGRGKEQHWHGCGRHSCEAAAASCAACEACRGQQAQGARAGRQSAGTNLRIVPAYECRTHSAPSMRQRTSPTASRAFASWVRGAGSRLLHMHTHIAQRAQLQTAGPAMVARSRAQHRPACLPQTKQTVLAGNKPGYFPGSFLAYSFDPPDVQAELRRKLQVELDLLHSEVRQQPHSGDFVVARCSPAAGRRRAI